MRTNCVKKALLTALALLLAFWVQLIPSQAMAAPQRVAILPFEANAPGNINYLVKGIRDMLASRLAWQDKVTVIEPDLVTPVMEKIKPPYNVKKARLIGKELSAQAVVFGSITVFGQAVSVDAKVVKVESKDPPISTFVQASDQNQVIPRINDFAQKINAELFERPDAVQARQAASGQPAAGKAAQGSRKATKDEKLIGKIDTPAQQWAEKEPDLANLPPNVSPLNPLFLRQLSGIESDRYWKSPRIKGNITSIAVDDIDLDGKNEIVALQPNSIRIYRLAGQHFALIYHLKNGPKGKYLFVDTADIDGDGRPEIFVSNTNEQSVSSFVMEWSKGGLVYKLKDSSYYFRVLKNPVSGEKKLYAQKRNIMDAFMLPIWEMKYENGEYVPAKEINLPENATIYNFTYADLNDSGNPMVVMYSPSWNLQVYSSDLHPVWSSMDIYGVSAKYVPYPPSQSLTTFGDESTDDAWFLLPTRILLDDLNGDRRAEVVVIKNKDRTEGFLEKYSALYQGQIHAMDWNGLSLVENWRTPRIGGYLTDFAIADVGNVGRPALVLSVNQTMLKGFLEKDTAHIIAFTLKPKAMQRKAPKNKGL